jgi:dihydropteroate synthase
MHLSDLRKGTAGKPLIMGILNVTPDSFSDGGIHSSRKKALEHAYFLIEQGADIIDVGGESTRPGADPVTEKDEYRRVIDVIEELSQTTDVLISIDTSKPFVAEEAVKVGAAIINDVCGLRNEAMIDVAVMYGVLTVIMHMHGTPSTFETDTMEGDVLSDIKKFLDERVEYALFRGVKEKNIILDPGIGFGKTSEQDMKIIDNCGLFSGKFPVMIGPSRKRFLAQNYPGMDPDEATALVSKKAADNGARILRVHDVRKVRTALRKGPTI